MTRCWFKNSISYDTQTSEALMIYSDRGFGEEAGSCSCTVYLWAWLFCLSAANNGMLLYSTLAALTLCFKRSPITGTYSSRVAGHKGFISRGSGILRNYHEVHSNEFRSVCLTRWASWVIDGNDNYCFFFFFQTSYGLLQKCDQFAE